VKRGPDVFLRVSSFALYRLPPHLGSWLSASDVVAVRVPCASALTMPPAAGLDLRPKRLTAARSGGPPEHESGIGCGVGQSPIRGMALAEGALTERWHRREGPRHVGLDACR
jgi:hypothetical protein